MAIEYVKEENFEEVAGKGTVLIDFYADWCFPCKSMSPILEKIAEKKPELTIAKINTDENQNLAIGQFKVRSIPTFVLLKDGQEVKRSVGTSTVKEMIEWIEE